jgi:hypothetical protein
MTWIPSLAGGGVTLPQNHDTTHSPEGLWQLDGDANDDSGNARHLVLPPAAGTERYGAGITPALQSFFFDGSTRIQRAAVAALQITGDVTLELLVYPAAVSGAGQILATMQSTGADTEPNNTLYSFEIDTDNVVRVFFEKGAGGNNFLIPSPPFVVGPGRWHHLAYTRGAANKIYHDGTEIFDDAGSFGNPTGGTNAFITLGSSPDGSSAFTGYLASVKIIASELSAAQVAAEASRTLSLGFAP